MLLFHWDALGFRITKVKKNQVNKQQHGLATRSTWNDLEYKIQNNKISTCDRKEEQWIKMFFFNSQPSKCFCSWSVNELVQRQNILDRYIVILSSILVPSFNKKVSQALSTSFCAPFFPWLLSLWNVPVLAETFTD